MKILVSVCVLLSLECITGLDPALDGDPKRNFPTRRAIDGSRGRKYYVPEEEDTFDIYGFGGQYDRDTTDFSDIRMNVPGEPGVDYPSYSTIPQTSFQCQSQFKGYYYADEEAGCQLFHVCDANFLVSSFLCPIGSIFSQKLLTCDWWNKVDCSSTRNYYIVNHQVSDDEILRKAYEMTRLQTSQKDISIDSRTRNSIVETARFVNDLQTNLNHYSDYVDNLPDGQYKYSSSYNSGDYRDRGSYDPMVIDNNQRTPKIRVHTIGQDNKNDADGRIRGSRPYYAPTVPTVTTTTRRFYSPTIPTTSARPMSRPGHDLEFESSEHLYSARGKTSQTSTIPSVTKPTVNTTTPVIVEGSPRLSDAYHSRIDHTASPLVEPATKVEIVTDTSEVTMDKSHLLTEFSAIEYQSLYSGENHTYQIDIDDSHARAKQTAAVEIPSTHLIPPFFYYSNIDQHNISSLIFINASPIIQNVPKIGGNGSLIDNTIPAPSKLFLPPLDDFQLENSTIVIPNNAEEGWDQNNKANRKADSVESESSPVVKGEGFNLRNKFIKSLIAKDDSSSNVRDVEIEVVSQRTTKNLSFPQNTTISDLNVAGDVSRARIINYTVFNKLQDSHPLRSLKILRDKDHLPRPFSLDTRQASRRKLTSENFSHEHGELKGKKKILQLSAQTFGHSEPKIDAPLEFELPHVTRIIDFRSGKKMKNLEEQASGEKEEEDEKEEDHGELERTSDRNDTLVDTELIPSIGFSLKEYIEAVMRGFHRILV